MLIFKNVNFYIITFIILYIFNFSYLHSNEPYGISFQSIKEQYLGKNQQFLNNSKIKIIIKDEIEEAHEVSMVVKIPKTLKNTKRIFILVDNNPIQLVTKIIIFLIHQIQSWGTLVVQTPEAKPTQVKK